MCCGTVSSGRCTGLTCVVLWWPSSDPGSVGTGVGAVVCRLGAVVHVVSPEEI